MKLTSILVTIGLAAVTSAHAQAIDAHAQAAALLSPGNRIGATVPRVAVPAVAPSEALDSQMRAANLLSRPVPSEAASAAAAAQPRRTTGTAADAHELARHLLDPRA